MSEGRRLPGDLWAALMSDVSDEDMKVEVTADDLNQLSVVRLAHGAERSRLRLRLHGAGVEGHDVAARLATSVIWRMQEVVTAVGASILGRSTSAGAVSADIQRATELKMTPNVGAGSVVFTLVPRDVDDAGLVDRAQGGDGGEHGTLLERSLGKTLDLITTVARDDPNDQHALQEIQSFGPRARAHLLALSKSLLAGRVDVDADWLSTRGTSKRATLDRRAASTLERVSRESYKRHEIEDLTGYLVTVSSEERQSLRLADGSRVKLMADATQQLELAKHFDRLVRVRVQAEITVTVSTGAERKRYRVEAVEPLY